jgi:hypothetical protein
MAEEGIFGRHWPICSLHSAESITTSMGLKEGRSFVTSVSRIMSEHNSVRSHLDRFGIVEDPMCVCLKDYETVDHLIWYCERFGLEVSLRSYSRQS